MTDWKYLSEQVLEISLCRYTDYLVYRDFEAAIVATEGFCMKELLDLTIMAKTAIGLKRKLRSYHIVQDRDMTISEHRGRKTITAKHVMLSPRAMNMLHAPAVACITVNYDADGEITEVKVGLESLGGVSTDKLKSNSDFIDENWFINRSELEHFIQGK